MFSPSQLHGRDGNSWLPPVRFLSYINRRETPLFRVKCEQYKWRNKSGPFRRTFGAYKIALKEKKGLELQRKNTGKLVPWSPPFWPFF
jgi:hypothetical protein